MIVDGHVHAFPGVYGYTGSGESRIDGRGLVHRGDGSYKRLLPPLARDGAFPAGVLLDYMDMAGVDRAVVVQGISYGPLNDYVAGVVAAHGDRLIGCGMLDPFVEGSDRLYERIVGRMGFRTLKFECSVPTGLAGIHAEFDYLASRWERIWDQIDADGLTVILDTGMPGTLSFNPERLAEVVDRYRRCRIVIAHLGFPPGPAAGAVLEQQWRSILDLGKRPNVWFELAGVWAVPGDVFPSPIGQQYVRRAVETLGASRLIWGSDMPGILNTITYEQALDFIAMRCEFLSAAERDLILGANALVVYQQMA
ncbi:MAG: amidohydrolase family protein [Candidatus Limnocylindrales bacterium]|jgi:predicted TIM-barrel fold metal-dependent hydrolase